LLQPGGTLAAGRYEFVMRELSDVQGPNYIAKEAVVDVRHDGDFVAQLRPQKRQYQNENWMTEAGIHAGWNRDLIISLGEQVGSDVWSVRVQYRPLVRFIWLGALIMAFGGLLAVSDRRYRATADAESTS
ncbi:MAG: hypothetical protein IIC62_05590, partial [Proteobacteria bacterium]|nr:hypothetical protein [Pseudomonadota bacterium]